MTGGASGAVPCHVALSVRLDLVEPVRDGDGSRVLGQREGMIAGMNDVESLELQILNRDIRGARHCGGRGTFDFKAEAVIPAHDQKIELRPGMGSPEKTFVGLDAQPADKLVRSEERRVGKECRSRW